MHGMVMFHNSSHNLTRQVYNLFQDLFNKFLGFIQKVDMQKCVQKMFKKLMAPKPKKVRRLRHRQTCFQTSGHRIVKGWLKISCKAKQNTYIFYRLHKNNLFEPLWGLGGGGYLGVFSSCVSRPMFHM